MELPYAPEVALPPNVAVTQLADGFFGKTSVERRQTGTEGQTGRRPGRDALLASLKEQRQRYPGDREAAICSKGMQDDGDRGWHRRRPRADVLRRSAGMNTHRGCRRAARPRPTTGT